MRVVTIPDLPDRVWIVQRGDGRAHLVLRDGLVDADTLAALRGALAHVAAELVVTDTRGR
ncbi:hypothetical protein [Protofrankia coriariae]|uniref:Uncharacterized protein n=1 Tax=Protofrankia coriariae TaxID=1562887 RepID=A0ABR5F270_9ACTN|nr:hypothetical protein [Protofrankia coriariae]KLL10816.1 hypothetical protein FrCorBMG51_15475 [Protofrankia coriariae]